ncbi:MAG: hypothetical protein LBQ60_19525 [Bacteroidales bacterium]|nr:hypothetical protein [Bacteroidales bacterium]
MKTSKWLYLLLAVVFSACSGSSEDEYVGNWEYIGDFAGPGRAHAATFVIDNVGYVCAGDNGYKTSRRDLWKVVIDSNGEGSWSNTTDSLPKGMERQRAVGFSVNGKGYVGTGWDGDQKVMRDFWEYDPAKSGQLNPDGTSAAWRQVAPMPAERGAVERYDALSFELNGVVYVGTGYTAGADKQSLLDFWEFVPPADENSLGEWKEAPSIKGSKRRGAVAFVIDGYAYVCTGANSGNTGAYDFWRFDGTEWTQLRNIISYDDDDDYDDKYERKMLRQRAVAFVINKKGYIALGSAVSSGSPYTTWEYETPVYSDITLITGDIWTQKTSFFNNSYTGNRDGAFVLSFPGKGRGGEDLVLIGCGQQSSAFTEDIWRFYPDDEDNTKDDRY